MKNLLFSLALFACLIGFSTVSAFADSCTGDTYGVYLLDQSSNPIVGGVLELKQPGGVPASTGITNTSGYGIVVMSSCASNWYIWARFGTSSGATAVPYNGVFVTVVGPPHTDAPQLINTSGGGWGGIHVWDFTYTFVPRSCSTTITGILGTVHNGIYDFDPTVAPNPYIRAYDQDQTWTDVGGYTQLTINMDGTWSYTSTTCGRVRLKAAPNQKCPQGGCFWINSHDEGIFDNFSTSGGNADAFFWVW